MLNDFQRAKIIEAVEWDLTHDDTACQPAGISKVWHWLVQVLHYSRIEAFPNCGVQTFGGE